MPRRFSRRRSSPKRQAVWFDTIVDFTQAGNGSSIVNLDSNIVQAQKKGMTVVRILLDLLVMPQGTGSGPERTPKHIYGLRQSTRINPSTLCVNAPTSWLNLKINS